MKRATPPSTAPPAAAAHVACCVRISITAGGICLSVVSAGSSSKTLQPVKVLASSLCGSALKSHASPSLAIGL